jgi:hypothetical protein
MVEKFWKLGISNMGNRSTVTFDDAVSYKPEITCELDPSHNRFIKRPLYTMAILTRKPQSMEDILWGSYSTKMLTNKALQALNEGCITGFTYVTISARYHKKKEQIDYPPIHRINITGWGGVCPEESGCKLIDRCKCGMMTFSRVEDCSKEFDISQWDGSDMFRVWPIGSTIVTNKVYDIVNANKLKGFKFKEPEKDDLLPIKTFRRGSLREFYDDEQAARLGKPLGIY